jgi:putative aldouronate transport system permease protein
VVGKTSSKKETAQDRVFIAINSILLAVVFLSVAYPLLFILSASISSPDSLYRGEVWLFPKAITFEGYTRVMANKEIWMGYRNTVFYTVFGTLINLAVIIPCGYVLSRKEYRFRTPITIMFTFTMFFSGGLIPTYLVVDSLGLINTVWAMLLPGAANMVYIIIARTYIKSNIHDSLWESAAMDGCIHTRFLFQIVLPLSKPIIAVLALFCGVIHWNSYFNALIYLSNRELVPLQLILREILIINDMGASEMMSIDDAQIAARMLRLKDLVKYAVMVVSALPLLVAYPFLQKYFATGVMMGAIKG